MSYLQIQVDGVYLDFQVTPEKFFFTYSIKGLEDFTKVGGALTERSIKIPATNKNDAVFEKWWHTVGDNDNAANFKDITISDGGQFVFKGQCLLKKVELYGDHYGIRGKFYQIACYANNTDFIINLQGKLMSEIPNLPQGLKYDLQTVQNGQALSPDIIDYTNGFIKFGNWSTAGRVSIYESVFCLYLRPLIISLFNDLGYNVQSNFLQTEEFKHYCMPLVPFAEAPESYGRYLGNVRLSDTQGVQPPLGPDVPLIFNTIDEDAIGFSPYNPANGRYTAQFDGFYSFEIVLRSRTSAAPPRPYAGRAIKNQDILNPIQVILTGTAPAGQFEEFTFVVGTSAQAGDFFEFFFSTLLQDMEIDLISLRSEVTSVNNQANYPVIVEELLRDYTQSDFIAGVQHAFNLNIEANSYSRNVIIEPADDYITTNYSPFVEEQKEGFFNGIDNDKVLDTLPKSFITSESSKLTKRVKYTYKVNDPTSEALDDQNEIGYHDGVYAFEGDRYKSGVKKIENPFFHKTPTIFDEEVRGVDSVTTPMFPIVWPENYFEDKSPAFNYENVAPRIFYSKGRVPLNTIYLFTSGVIDAPDWAYNQLLMVDYLDPSSGAPSLSFDNVTVNNVEVKGLLRRYYLPELKRLQVGKLLETWLFWRGLDVSNITFRNKIYLDGSLFVLQLIKNFDPITSASTKTQLLLDAPVEAGDEKQIENSNVNPLIIA